MIYSDLITQIKTEARIQKDTEFDAMVIGLLNEAFKEAVESQRPFELRTEVVLPITAGTGFVTLPNDFFLHHQIEFIDVDTNKIWVLVDEDGAVQPAPRGFYGHPKAFEIEGSTLTVKPITSLVGGDQIRLVYYKTPPIVVTTSLQTVNPITRLEPFLIRFAVRRIRMFHAEDIQVAAMLQGDIASAASGYSKDEPELKATK